MRTFAWFIYAALVAGVTGCGDVATLPVKAGMGPQPTLPPPEHSLVPTVNIAPAKGWPAGAMPDAAPGLAVNAYANGLDHPRWLYVLPNGDVLVAETNAPPKPEDGKGIKGWFMKRTMKRAGAGAPSANRITLLRDADGDGVAETRTVFLQGLNSPFGMALVGHDLYVANTDAVVRFPYTEGETQIDAPGVKVADLPAGPINHHWTKNIIASRDGSHLYVTVGSNSNVGENGMDKEVDRAAILEIDLKSGQIARLRLRLAQSQRPGLATAERRAVDGGQRARRDRQRSRARLHDVGEGRRASTAGRTATTDSMSTSASSRSARISSRRRLCPTTRLGPHTASLGLTFYDGKLFPRTVCRRRVRRPARLVESQAAQRLQGDLRAVRRRPSRRMRPEDVLTGFVDDSGDARGRPVGVAVDRAGALLVADDVGNVVWRVTPDKSSSASAQH